MIKLPTGNEGPTALDSGKTDFLVDGIVSKRTKDVEVSGYAGFIMRGNPDGYALTNGIRWGFGAGFPTQRQATASVVTAELFGEHYFNKTITAPAGLFGADGSLVPISTHREESGDARTSG